MINKRGGSTFFAIVLAIVIFIVGMTTMNLVMPEVTTARSANVLNCVNISNISDGSKLTCLAVDLIIPYWFIIILSVAGGVIFKYLKV